MIPALTVASALLALQSAPAPAWTWTLYEDRPLVLAEEVPDTPQLRTTLECQAGSGVARLSLYGLQGSGGFMRMSAGDASATGEAAARAGAVSASLPVNHPAFVRFVADGKLAVVHGEQSRPVELTRSHLAKLRRFAELCAG